MANETLSPHLRRVDTFERQNASLRNKVIATEEENLGKFHMPQKPTKMEKLQKNLSNKQHKQL
jgi:hypothetical protein